MSAFHGALAGALAVGVSACGGPGIVGTGMGGAGAIAGAGGAGGAGGGGIGHGIDLLFVLDDSAFDVGALATFQGSAGSLFDALAALPGGLPDVHVAVTTADLGAGDGSSIGGCSVDGDGAVFRFAPTGTCTVTGLAAGASFLTDTGGQNPKTNFGGPDLAAAFGCIFNLGPTGCGFQQPLAAAVRALGADGVVAPPENAGFLRPEAVLAVVLLSKEDDCSVPKGTPLFNATSGTLASMYGPTQHFLCSEWGHLCVPPGGGAPARPSRYAPNGLVTDTVTYSPAGGPDNCVSAEGQGLLLPVGAGGIADQLKSLKGDPAHQIVVAAILRTAIRDLTSVGSSVAVVGTPKEGVAPSSPGPRAAFLGGTRGRGGLDARAN